MFTATVTMSHTTPTAQHVANASELKSVKANIVATAPKPEIKTDTGTESYEHYMERNKKANEIWDFENPTFQKVAGTLCYDFHHQAMTSIDSHNTPFIEEWFSGYITSKRFSELSEEKKQETLWLYESTKAFWQKIEDWAWELKAGFHEPSIEEVLSPDFTPTNKPNRYPL